MLRPIQELLLLKGVGGGVEVHSEDERNFENGFDVDAYPGGHGDASVDNIEEFRARHTAGFAEPNTQHVSFASSSAPASVSESPAQPPSAPASYAGLSTAKGDHNPQASGLPY